MHLCTNCPPVSLAARVLSPGCSGAASADGHCLIDAISGPLPGFKGRRPAFRAGPVRAVTDSCYRRIHLRPRAQSAGRAARASPAISRAVNASTGLLIDAQVPAGGPDGGDPGTRASCLLQRVDPLIFQQRTESLTIHHALRAQPLIVVGIRSRIGPGSANHGRLDRNLAIRGHAIRASRAGLKRPGRLRLCR